MPHQQYKTIAIAGATGNLGAPILNELINSQLFDITVLTRETSNHTFPPSIKVTKVNFDSLTSLTNALAGHDALVSTIGNQALSSQKLLIDAAITAGVKRIIPSEFGGDLSNPLTRALPVFATKVEIEDHLKDLALKHSISYTFIYTGPFLDLGLANGLFFSFKDRKAEILDGGDQLVSATRITTAAKAVRRVLTHVPETADRAIWVKDIDVSQNQLLKLAQALTPGVEWEVTHVETAALEKEARAQLASGEVGPAPLLDLIKVSIFAPGYGGLFKHNHNAVLGVRELEEKDLVGVVRTAFGWEETVRGATDGPYIPDL